MTPVSGSWTTDSGSSRPSAAAVPTVAAARARMAAGRRMRISGSRGGYSRRACRQRGKRHGANGACRRTMLAGLEPVWRHPSLRRMHDVPAQRVRRLNQAPIAADGAYVLYWMTAHRRLGWNFALQRAVEHALRLGRPLLIFEP